MWTSEEDRLWSTRPLRCDKAWNTEFTLWYHFTKFFGLRGRDEHRQLKFGDIELVTTMQCRKYLAFNERTTKTQDGVNADDRRETKPKLNSTGSDRDPVAVFGKFVAKRPTSMNTPDSPFYLTVIRGHTTAKEEWFYPKPMGKKPSVIWWGRLQKMLAWKRRLITPQENRLCTPWGKLVFTQTESWR